MIIQPGEPHRNVRITIAMENVTKVGSGRLVAQPMIAPQPLDALSTAAKAGPEAMSRIAPPPSCAPEPRAPVRVWHAASTLPEPFVAFFAAFTI